MQFIPLLVLLLPQVLLCNSLSSHFRQHQFNVWSGSDATDDPGDPLYLTPYITNGNIERGTHFILNNWGWITEGHIRCAHSLSAICNEHGVGHLPVSTVEDLFQGVPFCKLYVCIVHMRSLALNWIAYVFHSELNERSSNWQVKLATHGAGEGMESSMYVMCDLRPKCWPVCVVGEEVLMACYPTE